MSGLVRAGDSGRCPECGTLFEWALVLEPARAEVAWLAEHAHDWRGMVRRTPGTLLRLLNPPGCWREVGVTPRCDPWRAGRWLLALVATLHGVGSGLGYAIAWLERPGAADPYRALNCLLFPVLDASPGRVDVLARGWPWYVAPALAFSLAWPLLMAALPTTRRLAKLRWEHVLRAGLYGLAWVVALAVFRVGRNVLYLLTWALDPPTRTPPMPAAAGGPAMPWRLSGRPDIIRLDEAAPWLVGPVLLGYLAWWWWGACERGWSLARQPGVRGGRLVWPVLTMAAALVAAASHHWSRLVW